MNTQYPPPSPPKRRRWWVYALWAFGSLFALGVALVVAAILYWNSLVKTYTSPQSKPVPQVEAAAERFPELKERWEAYALLFIRRDQPIPDFELTSDELNILASRFGPFGKQAYIGILDDKLRFEFSTPLDRTGNPGLKGRFLNGVANLKLDYTNNRVSLRALTVELNGKPIPRWILRRVQQNNWASALNHRPEFDLAIRALDRIEVQPDRLVLHPAATAR